MLKRPTVLLVLLTVAALVSSLRAQSLGDVAATAAARRGAVPPAAKVYTNKDLPDEGTTTESATLDLTTTYDRMRDFTSITLDKMNLGSGLELSAWVGHTGHDLSPGEAASVPMVFHFVHSSSDWTYLRYHPLVLLLNDSVRVDLGSTSHDGRVGSGGVLEQMTVQVAPEQLHQIVNARKVEGQLGLTKFEFSPRQREGLQALAHRLGRR